MLQPNPNLHGHGACTLSFRLSPRLVNLLSALMPTLEGMLILSVIDGKRGEVLVRYHQGFAPDVLTLFRYLETTYPSEIHSFDLPPAR